MFSTQQASSTPLTVGRRASGEIRGRILVVDDEVNARTALSELLRDEGYLVESAADAFKALGKVADFAPDLVLTDLEMPGMDGLQLLGRLHETDPELPVVVMTAFGEVETAVRAMRSGARDYLSKPVNVGELSLVVARELEQGRLRIGPRIPGATLQEIERHAITRTLEATGGSTSRAAGILDISVRKIQYKLHEYEGAPKSSRAPVGPRA